MTKTDRVNRAQKCIDNYEGSTDEKIIDLLADLMHLSRKQGRSFLHMLDVAKMHFDAEKGDTGGHQQDGVGAIEIVWDRYQSFNRPNINASYGGFINNKQVAFITEYNDVVLPFDIVIGESKHNPKRTLQEAKAYCQKLFK